MVEYAPSTGGLALWVHHRDELDTSPDEAAPPVTTDGITLRYGPGFAALPLPQQVGHVAHEVLHIALRHPQRYIALQGVLGDVDLLLFNTCADAVVNSALSHLAWLELPAGAVLLDTLLESTLALAQPVEKSLLEWDVERLYRAIDDRRAARSGLQSQQQQQQQRGGQGGERQSSQQRPDSRPAPREDGPRSARARALGAKTARDLRPGPQTREAPEADAEAAREWSERLLRAHTGDGEFSMLPDTSTTTARRGTRRAVVKPGSQGRRWPAWLRPWLAM